MKSATVGIHLSLEAVPDDLLPWMGVLPSLVEETGVLHDGAPVEYGATRDRLRREVLALKVNFSTNARSGRAELAIEASGSNEVETRRALGWATDFLVTPDWRKENLPRLRDVLDAELAELHATMSHREEHWLKGLAEAYRHQENPLLLHTRSPLTRVHDAFLTSWQLQGGDDAVGVEGFLRALASAGAALDRDSLAKLASALDAPAKQASHVDPKLSSLILAARSLPPSAEARVRKAGRDLGLLLGDLPDASLAADWGALCTEMADAVARPPRDGLRALEKTLALVRHASHPRVWVVGSTAHIAAVGGDIDRLLASLGAGDAPRAVHSRREPIRERVRARGGGEMSSFVALVNSNTAGSALVASAASVELDETREDRLIDFLAVNVFGGQGTQSFYKRIWGSGLAYSGYLENNASRGRELFYTDRCADLPALLDFVDTEVRARSEDPRFIDYSVATAFGSRVADDFEGRARGMAADLTDGDSPEKVRAFRSRLLALRALPGLSHRMGSRFVAVMSPLLPLLSPASPLPDDAAYFAVAPVPRIDDYERALQRARTDARVTRIWPRDFWDLR